MRGKRSRSLISCYLQPSSTTQHHLLCTTGRASNRRRTRIRAPPQVTFVTLPALPSARRYCVVLVRLTSKTRGCAAVRSPRLDIDHLGATMFAEVDIESLSDSNKAGSLPHNLARLMGSDTDFIHLLSKYNVIRYATSDPSRRNIQDLVSQSITHKVIRVKGSRDPPTILSFLYQSPTSITQPPLLSCVYTPTMKHEGWWAASKSASGRDDFFGSEENHKPATWLQQQLDTARWGICVLQVCYL